MLKVVDTDVCSERKCEQILTLFCRTFQREQLNFTIEFSRNAFQRISEIYSYDFDYLTAITNTQGSISAESGFCCYPYAIVLPFFSISSDEQIQTIFHEISHYYDYSDYCRAICNNEYKFLMRSKWYKAFWIWTEYHSKMCAFHIAFEYSFIPNITDINIIEEKAISIATQICEQYIDRYANAKSINDKLYHTVHFLGVLAVLSRRTNNQVGFNSYFPIDVIEPLKRKLVQNLNSCLLEMVDFVAAFHKFADLQDITGLFSDSSRNQ